MFLFFGVLMICASVIVATEFSSIHFCSDLKPQLHVNIEQITGMWYGVEIINHKQEEEPEVRYSETCPILYITDDSTPSTSAPNLYNDYNPQQPQIYGQLYGHGYQDRTYTNTDPLNRDRDISRDREQNRDINDDLYNRQYNYPYQEQTAEEIAAQQEYDRQVYMRLTNPNYNRGRYGTPITATELARRRALYGDIRRLRLLWDENGSGVEYTMRYNVSTAGFWISSGPQNGSALEPQYNHFAGTVQVLKAVGNHMVLSFCHQLPDRQLYTVILSRVPMLNKQEIHGVHNLLNRKGLSTSNVRKVCAHSGAPGGAATVYRTGAMAAERSVNAIVGIVMVRWMLWWRLFIMALVMLPCDLPWWSSVSKHLTKLTNTKNTHELIEGMQKIHDMCCVSLDPDEEPPDPEQFIGLLNFLDNDLNSQDRSNFFNKTLPAMVKRALQMKELKPRGGLHFSLQQQPDFVELPRAFVSSLLANAFFSTFPKRTSKSHPTLQNFNFSYFFKYLSDNVQKSKLRGILQYFDWLEIEEHANGTIKFLRQVMSSKEWLTIEDWLECTLPLCPLQIRHHGRMEKSESDALHMCFSSAKIGGSVLENGQNQECVNLCTIPEILSVLLNVESLEDNEVFRIENVSVTSRIIDPKNRANFEKNESPDQITVCCVDAEDYSKLPLGQYEEDNVLRELNKCLLAFQQKQHKECHPNITVTHSTANPHPAALHKQQQQRRLSPIGESMGSNSDRLPIITRQSCSTKSGGSVSFEDNKNNNSSTNANSNLLAVKAEYTFTPRRVADTSEAAIANRRGRFIILGSSGECLPVKRIKSPAIESSLSSSLDESEEDEFHSARSSLEDVSEDEDCHKRYSIELDTKEHRSTFAKRLQDALRRENSSLTTESVDSESSYAVGISVTGSGLLDQDIKVRRRGSTGFLLQEESLDEDFLNHSLQQEQQWIDKFKSKQTGLSRKESNKSSEYSFSTDYSGSELEEVYEQFSRWLENPLLETEKGKKRQLDARDLAVVQFAGSLLKRTLSESFAGVPIMDGCEQNSANTNPPEFRNDAKHKLVLNAKSLSLELARHKHKLAAQLAEYVEPNVLAEAAVESPVNKETPNIVVPTVSDKSCEGQSNAVVTKRVKPRLNWVATTVTAVVQTLEDICVNVSLPLSKPEAVTQVTLSQITLRPKGGIRPISTGNWGCGTSKRGDVQLKVLIQWMAASVAGTPSLIYYTYGHKELATLDTLCRLLIDRRWSVKDLTRATLRFASRFIHDGGTTENGGDSNHTLFEELIGVDRTS